MSKVRSRSLMGAALIVCALAAHGAERANAKSPIKLEGKSATPDLDFLEYLGTLEDDEENWTDVAKMELPDTTQKATVGAKPEPAAKSAGSVK